MLPRALKLFAERFPRVQILLTESDDDAELLGKVEAGDLDLTFIVFPMTDGPFEAINLLEDVARSVNDNEEVTKSRAIRYLAEGATRPQHRETKKGPRRGPHVNSLCTLSGP
jgi:DNA-binding transcriptional LysR family regulator